MNDGNIEKLMSMISLSRYDTSLIKHSHIFQIPIDLKTEEWDQLNNKEIMMIVDYSHQIKTFMKAKKCSIVWVVSITCLNL